MFLVFLVLVYNYILEPDLLWLEYDEYAWLGNTEEVP